jgi:transposase
VKGFRPVVGTWDRKDMVYVFGVLNVVSGKLTMRLLECPARLRFKTGKSTCRHLQETFARHLRDLAGAYPGARFPKVVILIDNAPWHRGALIIGVLEEFPPLVLSRLPSYCPDLNPIERLWKVLRRRATHNRLFETMSLLRHALRGSLCYFQTCRHRVLSLLDASKRQRRRSEKNINAP